MSAISTMPNIKLNRLRVIELRTQGGTVVARAPEAIHAIEDGGGV
jgi:hypothetical protein